MGDSDLVLYAGRKKLIVPILGARRSSQSVSRW